MGEKGAIKSSRISKIIIKTSAKLNHIELFPHQVVLSLPACSTYLHNMNFERLPPTLRDHISATDWLKLTSARGRADNTVLAYGYVLADFIRFCQTKKIDYLQATRQQVITYFNDLDSRPLLRNGIVVQQGLSTASRKQRFAVLRLYYGYLIHEKIRNFNPLDSEIHVARNRHGNSKRGFITHKKKSNWIPDRNQLDKIFDAMKNEPIRNKVMFMLSYECALRRGELCLLEVNDISIGKHGNFLHIRGETTKTKQPHTAKFSDETRNILIKYMAKRSTISSKANESLFLSESTQNKGKAISFWTWTKAIRIIAQRTRLPRLTPHTLRRLGISHFADQGKSMREVSDFAAHKSEGSTEIYIHRTPDALHDTIEAGLLRIAQSKQQKS